MLDFRQTSLPDDIKSELLQLDIDYAFQPIYYPDARTVYAYEALMRPKGTTVSKLIFDYFRKDKLHVIEVATFFCASDAFARRGYDAILSVNSFPSEQLTEDEIVAAMEYFSTQMYPGLPNGGIIEILEYPKVTNDIWKQKRDIIDKSRTLVAVDDFGSGAHQNFDVIDSLDPHIVKLDRSLFADVDSDVKKQEYLRDLIPKLHERNLKIVGEGIETEPEFTFLEENGVDFFQGFLLGMPK